MLTISKLSRWSINYYNDTANAVGQAVKDARKAGGGLGEYYTEHDTRTPVWQCAGDTHSAANLVGLTDIQRAGAEADTEVAHGGWTTVSRRTGAAVAHSEPAACTASI